MEDISKQYSSLFLQVWCQSNRIDSSDAKQCPHSYLELESHRVALLQKL